MTLESLIPWLVYLPMLGFGITALVGRRLGRASGYIPVAAIFLVWVIAMALCYQVLTESAPLLPIACFQARDMPPLRLGRACQRIGIARDVVSSLKPQR